MGLMNSEEALGKDQHKSWTHLKIAKKDTHHKSSFKEVFSVTLTLLFLSFSLVVEQEEI